MGIRDSRQGARAFPVSFFVTVWCNARGSVCGSGNHRAKNSESMDLKSSENSESMDLKSSENSESMDLKSSENSESMDLKSSENSESMDLKSSENSESMDLKSSENSESMDLKSSENSENKDTKNYENGKNHEIRLVLNEKQIEGHDRKKAVQKGVQIREQHRHCHPKEHGGCPRYRKRPARRICEF